MNLSDAINRVIELARKVSDYYETELPKRHPNYPLVGPEGEDTPPPPEEKELGDFLATLPEEQIYQILLLIDFARGERGSDNMAEYYDGLKVLYGDEDEARSHLIWHVATLADALTDSIEELRKHKINVDKLPLKKAKARKR
jgi:hypothetical protein